MQITQIVQKYTQYWRVLMEDLLSHLIIKLITIKIAYEFISCNICLMGNIKVFI